MSPIPIITGLGLATPLGNTVGATWAALCAGESITDHARVPQISCAGEPRVNALARRVAREALAEACWRVEEIRSAALIVGTSKGPVDAWLGDPSDKQVAGESSLSFGLAETATPVALDVGCAGPRLTLSAACASGLHALIRAAMMIRSGEVDRALVVACESSLHPLFIGSFQRLGVVPPPGHGCRPFDRNRAGFLIGEAAAAVCLAAAPSADDPGRGQIVVERFAMGADATHLTAGDPNGVALRRLLKHVIDSRAIDLVHAHGTGTVANDPIELAAIESALPRGDGNCPSLYSHKGAFGHTLGAAGLAAVVINCLSHRHGIVPPNVRTTDPLPATAVDLRVDLHHRHVRRSMAIAAGFGGAIAAVTLVSTSNIPL